MGEPRRARRLKNQAGTSCYRKCGLLLFFILQIVVVCFVTHTFYQDGSLERNGRAIATKFLTMVGVTPAPTSGPTPAPTPRPTGKPTTKPPTNSPTTRPPTNSPTRLPTQRPTSS